MKLPKKAVSLGNVAKAANLTRMSVSYALRNMPGVSEGTRRRVKRIAAKLGYQPDARMATAMRLVRDTKTRVEVPIAWLTTDKKRGFWQNHSYQVPFYQGAAKRCEERGYRLEEFWLREPRMTMKRMSLILYQRGIRGVIVAPPEERAFGFMRLEWKHFAAVTFMGGIVAPQLPQVVSDDYYNLRLALKRLRRLGYRRIGVCLPKQMNRRSMHLCAAAIHQFNVSIPAGERVPEMIHNEGGEIAGPEFSRWIKRYRPDVVVGRNSGLIKWLEACRLRVPRDVGVAHLALDGDCEEWAGIRVRKKEMGLAAADLVISLVESNRVGLLEVPFDLTIRGKWQSGFTLSASKGGSA